MGSPVSINSSMDVMPSVAFPVHRDLLAGAHAEQITDDDLVQRDLDFNSVADDPPRFRLESDEPPDGARGLALCAPFEPLPEEDEPEDDCAGVEVRLGVESGLVHHLGPHRDEYGVAPRGARSNGETAYPWWRRRACLRAAAL